MCRSSWETHWKSGSFTFSAFVALISFPDIRGTKLLSVDLQGREELFVAMIGDMDALLSCQKVV
jgi:hypothetical protein